MGLTVVRAAGMVSVQDLGRPGHMHEGLARGGALVPELLVAANRRAGNADEAAAIEVMGTITVSASRDVVVATDRMAARDLCAREELTVASETRRVSYLAVRGGVDTPMVLGSRSAQLSAGLGARLRAGGVLPVGTTAAVAIAVSPFLEPDRIRVVVGPDRDAFEPAAFDALTSAPYVVLPVSDRVGTRLEGPVLARTARPDVTRPMVRGAIEVPRDGQPIVLGPEHPTTGGYPIVGVIVRADLGAFFAIAAGRTVRFTVE